MYNLSMKVIGKVVFLVLSVAFLLYLSLPNYPYPTPLPGSFESKEEADTEDYHERRAYFTNFSREEVMQYYTDQISDSAFWNLPMPTYRLNYPPEDAFSLIRDQTRSTGLEEIVQPFRQSFFVNFYEPVNDPQNAISYKGIPYRQKITVAYKPSNVFARLGLGVTTVVLGRIVWVSAVSELQAFWLATKRSLRPSKQ